MTTVLYRKKTILYHKLFLDDRGSGTDLILPAQVGTGSEVMKVL